MTRRFLAAVLLATLLGGAARAADPRPVTFGHAEVTLEVRGQAHRLSVEVATTLEQRERGLMYRDSLPADRGMLFVFPEERVVYMWMKDTRIPLDMLFLGPDGRILKIAAGAVPNCTDIISSGVPAKGVLELAGGAAARLEIRDGDRVVVHPAFAP